MLWNAGKATTGLATNLPGQVPQILFIAQLTLSPPAFYVYRRLAAAVLQLNFLLEAFLSLGAVLSSCRRLLSTSTVSTVLKSSAVWVPLFFRYSAFLYLIIFFICSVSPVCPFLPLLFASGLRSEKRLFFSFAAFLMRFPAVSISCSRIALQTLDIL